MPESSRPAFGTMPPLPTNPPGGAPADVPPAVWSSILDALASKLGRSVDADDVELVSAEAMTWNDGSLGCPKPGEMYTQALVDGYHVVVEVDGEEFDYRAPNRGSPRLCESPLPRSRSTP